MSENRYLRKRRGKLPDGDPMKEAARAGEELFVTFYTVDKWSDEECSAQAQLWCSATAWRLDMELSDFSWERTPDKETGGFEPGEEKYGFVVTALFREEEP